MGKGSEGMERITLHATIPDDVWEQFGRILVMQNISKSDWLKDTMLRKMGYRRDDQSDNVPPNFATRPIRLRGEL
mgnify:CR=1